MHYYVRAEVLRETAAPASPVTAVVDVAALPGTWVPAQLPYVAKKTETVAGAAGAAQPGARTTTWFRIRLAELDGWRGPTHFYLLRWLAAGQLAVYADGRLVYRSVGSPVWNLFSHPALLLPLNRTADSAPPKTLLIRLDSVPTRDAVLSSFYVGDPDTLIARAAARDWIGYQLPFMVSATFVAVGIFSLAVWVFRRHPSNLLVFFISVLSMARRWHFQMGLEKLPIADAWFIWITLNALLWQIITTHFFLQILHGQRQAWLRWFGRSLLGLGIAISLVTLPATWIPLSPLLVLRAYVQVVVIGIAFAVAGVGVWAAWRGRSFDARLLAVIYVISTLVGVADWAKLTYSVDVEGYYLTPHAALVYALTFMLIMLRRYLAALGEVEVVNTGLEQRLQAREAELAESYARLRDAEQRQTLSEERQRLTQDMHDGLGSSLVSALRVVESGHVSEAELGEVLRGCIVDLKLTIDSLEPVEADLLLLLATLRFRLGPRLESAGIALRWEVADVPALGWLDPRNSLHILRILQEAFANILKHTRASEIRVTTGAVPGWVTVTIADNGPGFDLAQARAGRGKGLQNQQRRAEAIGGEIVLESSAGGTRLTLRLPETR